MTQRKIHILAILLAVALPLAACGRGSSGGPAPGPTKTRVGLTVELPAGWVEVPTEGRPYTQTLENKERQLAIGLVDFPTNGVSIASYGDQVKRRLGSDGTLVESGATTVDGHEAFRVVSNQKTATGHGLVIATVIGRDPSRAAAIYVYSAGDQQEHHRAEMDAIVASIKVN
jgi:hypothetical protein